MFHYRLFINYSIDFFLLYLLYLYYCCAQLLIPRAIVDFTSHLWLKI